MADLDIARLRALLAKKSAAQAAFDESDAPIGTTEENELAHASIRADVALEQAVMEALPALLDLADPETLRFVLHKPSGVYRALAADAAFYELRPEYSGRGTVMERQDGYALVVPNERAWTHYPSLDSAIEAAREHDRRRRGSK